MGFVKNMTHQDWRFPLKGVNLRREVNGPAGLRLASTVKVIDRATETMSVRVTAGANLSQSEDRVMRHTGRLCSDRESSFMSTLLVAQ